MSRLALKTEIGATPQILLYAMLSVIAVMFFGLTDLDNTQEFGALLFFTMIYFLSFFLLMFISGTKLGDRIKGKNLTLWFFQPITFRKLIFYVPLGIGGGFLSSVFTNLVGTDEAVIRVVAITGAGIVFLALLIRTRSILIPTLAHGIFNTIVLIIQSNITETGQLLSISSYPIPVIGLTIGSLTPLASESIFQMLLVAPAEEFVKVLMMSFVMLAFKDKYDNKGIAIVVIAGIFSVLVWAFFHLIRYGVTLTL